MDIFILVNVEGGKKKIRYDFEDDLPDEEDEEKVLKSALDKYFEFRLACSKDCKSYRYYNNEIWVNALDGIMVRRYYFDVVDGGDVYNEEEEEGVEQEVEEPKEIIELIIAITGNLTYIGKQVCWCMLYCDMNINEVVRELKWCRRKIDTEIKLCKTTTGVKHIDNLKKWFKENHPDYIYSKLKEVKIKIKKKRIRRPVY